MNVLQPEVLGLIGALCIAGAIAGITAGLFGIGGGFVVVPALVALFPAFGNVSDELIHVAIGTSLASIIVSSARAVQVHRRRGAVDFAVLRDWSPWLLLGVMAGLAVAALTDGRRLFVVFALGVLAYSLYFLFPLRFQRSVPLFSMPSGFARAGLASVLGGFSALLGIGGGTVTVITMVMCNRPVHQAVATAAGVGFIIAVPGTLGFLLLGLGVEPLPFGSVGYVNVPALLAISALSIVTTPIGASLAHRLDELRLKRLFGCYLLFVAATMFYKSVTV